MVSLRLVNTGGEDGEGQFGSEVTQWFRIEDSTASTFKTFI